MSSVSSHEEFDYSHAGLRSRSVPTLRELAETKARLQERARVEKAKVSQLQQRLLHIMLLLPLALRHMRGSFGAQQRPTLGPLPRPPLPRSNTSSSCSSAARRRYRSTRGARWGGTCRWGRAGS